MLETLAPCYAKYVDRLATESEYFRKCAEQVDSKLEAVFEEIEEVLDYDTDIAGFESVFKSMIKTHKRACTYVSRLCVYRRFDQDFRATEIFTVLGANSGKLPPQSSGGVVITHKDEQTLSALGVEINPSEKQKLLNGMYFVCDLMKKPQGKLAVSYSDSGDGGALRPSTVVFELQNMLEKDGKPLQIERIDFEHFETLDGTDLKKAALLLSTKKSCFNETLKNGVSGRADAKDIDVFGSAYSLVSEEEKSLIEKSFVVPRQDKLAGKILFCRAHERE